MRPQYSITHLFSPSGGIAIRLTATPRVISDRERSAIAKCPGVGLTVCEDPRSANSSGGGRAVRSLRHAAFRSAIEEIDRDSLGRGAPTGESPASPRAGRPPRRPPGAARSALLEAP